MALASGVPFLGHDVAVALQPPGAFPDHQERDVDRGVRVAVAHAAAPQDDGVIQDRAVAVRRRRAAARGTSGTCVICHVLIFTRLASFSGSLPWCETWCHGSFTPRFGNTSWLASRLSMKLNTRVTSASNASGQQVEEHGRVVLEARGHADRRVRERQFGGRLPLRALDASFHLAGVLQILVEPRRDRAVRGRAPRAPRRPSPSPECCGSAASA